LAKRSFEEIAMSLAAKLTLALLAVLVVSPTVFSVGYGALTSFGFFSPTGENAFTLNHYAALFESGDLLRSFFFTVWVAGVSTALSFGIAFFIALVIHGLPGWNERSRFLIQLPLPVPHLAVAVLAILFLSQSGLASRILFGIGTIETQRDFPELLYDRFGIGIIAVYLWKEIPFLTLVMLSVMSSVGKNYERVAQSLGATRVQQIYFVTLPLVWRGARTSLMIVFVFIVGAFEVPLLIGATYPPMLSVLAHQRFHAANVDVKAESFAVSTLVSATILVLSFLYQRLSAKHK
jgi:putative spermidine/putrescine transport system permease protein